MNILAAAQNRKSRLATIKEGFSRDAVNSPLRSPAEEYYTQNVKARQLTLHVDEQHPAQFSADGEKRAVHQRITVELLPHTLELFASDIPLLNL